MSAPVPPAPHPDYAALTFPSDRVSVADIRRVHPGRFNSLDGEAFESLEDERGFGLTDALFLERLIAHAAFARAAGHPDDVYRTAARFRDDCVDELSDLYQRYGLAAGRHQTEQLVRDIEAQAALQPGRSR